MRQILAELTEGRELTYLVSGDITLSLFAHDYGLVVPRLFVIRFEVKGNLKFVEGRIQFTLRAQGKAKVVVRFGVVGRDARSGAEFFQRFLVPPESTQRNASSQVGLGEVRPQAKGLTKLCCSSPELALLAEGESQVVVRVGEFWVKLNRLPQFSDGIP